MESLKEENEANSNGKVIINEMVAHLNELRPSDPITSIGLRRMLKLLLHKRFDY